MGSEMAARAFAAISRLSSSVMNHSRVIPCTVRTFSLKSSHKLRPKLFWRRAKAGWREDGNSLVLTSPRARPTTPRSTQTAMVGRGRAQC